MVRLILALLVCCVCSSAWALSGRQWWIPLAETIKPSEFTFDLSARSPVIKDSGTAGIHNSKWGANFGLMEIGTLGVEGGLDWSEPSRDTVGSAVSANIRMSYGNLKQDGWAAAAGIDEFGFEPNFNTYQMVYAVFQSRYSEEWETLLGGYIGSGSTLGADGRENNGLLAGLWRKIQNGRGSLGAELMSGRNSFGYLVPGGRLEVRDGVFVAASYGIANDRPRYQDFFMLRTSIEF